MYKLVNGQRFHFITGEFKEMFRQLFVFDLDGVLVDTSHRYRNKPDGTIDLDYWFAMRTPENIAKDTLLHHSRVYFEANADPRIYTIICTSRMYNVMDIEFIVGYLGAPNKLLMRPEDERLSPDGQLKRRQLQRIFNLKQFKGLPKFLWEDNKGNIEALHDIFDNVTYVPSHISGWEK